MGCLPEDRDSHLAWGGGAAGVGSAFFCYRARIIGSLGFLFFFFSLTGLVILLILETDIIFLFAYVVFHVLFVIIAIGLCWSNPQSATLYQGVVLGGITLSCKLQVKYILPGVANPLAVRHAEIFEGHVQWLGFFFI